MEFDNSYARLPKSFLTKQNPTTVRSPKLIIFNDSLARSLGLSVQELADYTLKRHFPEVEADESRYLSLLKEVIKRQASLIAKWQLVGFIHGVMNTDNMAISGETIDYGPCAFMDTYDPATVFSSIDIRGRYAYGNQPNIAAWNLARFAETLLPLLHDNQEQAVKLAQDAVSKFAELYQNNWISGMRAKLGIFNEEQQDEALMNTLLSRMSTLHYLRNQTVLTEPFAVHDYRSIRIAN